MTTFREFYVAYSNVVNKLHVIELIHVILENSLMVEG